MLRCCRLEAVYERRRASCGAARTLAGMRLADKSEQEGSAPDSNRLLGLRPLMHMQYVELIGHVKSIPDSMERENGVVEKEKGRSARSYFVDSRNEIDHSLADDSYIQRIAKLILRRSMSLT